MDAFIDLKFVTNDAKVSLKDELVAIEVKILVITLRINILSWTIS